MLFGLARLLLGALAVGAVASIIIEIVGTITRDKLKEEMRSRGIEDMLIEKINNTENTITLKELLSGERYEVHGDDIDYDLTEGERIYIY